MSQIETIKQQLEETGKVSRNWCLQQYISRLSARILDLRNQGYEFTEERRKGDFVYKRVQEGQLRLF